MINLKSALLTTSEAIDLENYFTVTYFLESTSNLYEAAKEIAIGQSIGNPNVRSKWESVKLIENHCGRILNDNKLNLEEIKSGIIKIAFPLINIDFNEDGISHLLCIILGGQTDIDNIKKCKIINIILPDKIVKTFKTPKFGITGIRQYTKTYNKPLLGSIIKPKTGLSLYELTEITKELIDGGVNFIKEDEIISSPSFLPLKERVNAIAKLIHNKNVVYCFAINTDPLKIKDRVNLVYEHGGNGIHINVWSGLGSYKSIRDLDLPIFIHYQKSGERVFTHESNNYSINWNVLCYLAGLCGVDTIHTGMYGGYSSTDPIMLKNSIDILRSFNIMPALSCGLHAGLIDKINNEIGIDYLANSGGCIHGHPKGTKAGASAIKQAIDKNYGDEYFESLKIWKYEQ